MGAKKIEPQNRRCVILGGGEIVNYIELAGLLSENQPDDFVICADSGFSHCARLGVTPDLLVGDFDSLREEAPPGVPRVTVQAEKDYSDTALAIEEALERGYASLLLAGVLGGRLDHTLANLQSLADLSRRGVDAALTDGATWLWAVTGGTVELPPKADCYFSLFAFGGDCEGVTIRGAKYLLDRFCLRATDPRAISNEFLEGPAVISVEKGTLLVACVPKD